MPDRTGRAERKSTEVSIVVTINLDSPGYTITLSPKIQEADMQMAMIKHFLSQVLRLGEIGCSITGEGDFSHHLIEDLGICWGQALHKALGTKDGIKRTGTHTMPMEGTLVTVALDLSGRSHLECNFEDTDDKPLFEMVKHFLKAVTQHAEFDLYCKVETLPSNSAIRSDHHKLETLGKSFGIALYDATRITRMGIPSTKGIL